MSTVPPSCNVDSMIDSCQKALRIAEGEASRLRMRLAHLQAIKQWEQANEPKQGV